MYVCALCYWHGSRADAENIRHRNVSEQARPIVDPIFAGCLAWPSVPADDFTSQHGLSLSLASPLLLSLFSTLLVDLAYMGRSATRPHTRAVHETDGQWPSSRISKMVEWAVDIIHPRSVLSCLPAIGRTLQTRLNGQPARVSPQAIHMVQPESLTGLGGQTRYSLQQCRARGEK